MADRTTRLSRESLTATRRPRAARLTACLGASAIAAASLVLAGVGPAGAASPLLKSANVPNYRGIAENSASRSLYLLSTEKGAKVHCTGTCATTWIPLVVKSSVKRITVGKGVKGKIGYVKRSATTKQVTFNTYPVYTYKGDSGPDQSHGEGVAADGGVWHLVHASAASAGATPYATILNSITIPSSSYHHVLANGSSRSLYVLSVEAGGTLKCTGGCLSIWPPLLVAGSTTSVSLGAGVDGTIGFVARGSMKQVTFNSYPVYTYSGDASAEEACGQGIAADGGTWTLASATATTASATPVATGSGGCSGPGYVWGARRAGPGLA